MKCPSCHKNMIADIENSRYVCECGKEIMWVTRIKENGYEGIYIKEEGTIHWLAGNIDKDPLFVSVENGDFRLQENSPCIDAGTDYFKLDDDILVDISPGNYIGSAPDMGAFEFDKSTTVNEEHGLKPTGFSLYQNFPNPFNPVTSISFSLTRLSPITLIVYNIGGAKVATLVDDKFPAGIHNVVWDAGNYSSGLYFYVLETETNIKIGKMLLLK